MTDRFVFDLSSGERSLEARLGEILRGLEQPAELMGAIGARMEANVNLRFTTKRAPDGTAWLPLAASTRELYEDLYKGAVPGSLLERTRRMRNSLAHLAGDTMVEWGFSVPYAIYHETGTRRGLPRRQLLTDDPIAGTLGAGDRQDILDELQDFIGGLFAR